MYQGPFSSCLDKYGGGNLSLTHSNHSKLSLTKEIVTLQLVLIYMNYSQFFSLQENIFSDVVYPDCYGADCHKVYENYTHLH